MLHRLRAGAPVPGVSQILAWYAEVREAAGDLYVQARDAARSAWGAAVQADPTGATRAIERFVAWLAGTKAELDAAQRAAEQLPPDARAEAAQRLQAIRSRHARLAAGLYDGAADPTEAPVGAIPLLVAGIAFTAVGGAWAIAYETEARAMFADAQALRIQIERCAQLARDGVEVPEGLCEPRDRAGGAGGEGGASRWPLIAAGAGLTVGVVGLVVWAAGRAA